MDQLAIVAEATLLAGIVVSLLQERLAGFIQLEGRAAFIFNVVVCLVIGAVAVARTGGFIHVGGSDVFGVAASILLNAGFVLAGAQAAFRVLVRPISKV